MNITIFQKQEVAVKIEFTIPGNPEGKDRPRMSVRNGQYMIYTTRKTRDYEKLAKLSYSNEAKGYTFTGAVSAEITGYFPIPKSTSKRKRTELISEEVPYLKKIDCDNLAKAVLDALNGSAYADDRQVCDLTVRKRYSDNPRVEVIISDIE